MTTLTSRVGLSAAVILIAACVTVPIDLQPADDVTVVASEYAEIPRLEAGEGVEPPRVRRRVEPTSTVHMRSRRPLSASVEVVMNTDGVVEAAWYARGHREWAQDAARALYGWRFEPRNGVPFTERTVITITMQ